MENLELNGAARASFWRGRRVVVTGHTGFKGSWLTLWLDRLGALGDRHKSSADDNSQSFRRRENRDAVQESFFEIFATLQDLPT